MSLGIQLQSIVHELKLIGLKQVVVSPGSRNAPLVAAFLKDSHFQIHSFPDERSAAFAAMGMAQHSQHMCAFICTSGSALVNAFPAVCEAYYQRIPLLIMSADRPKELIDQWDGQTMRQAGIFGDYVRGNMHFNARKFKPNSIIRFNNQISAHTKGPLHINIAISDPIYEGVDTPKAQHVSFLEHKENPADFTPSKLPEIQPNESVLILIGQHHISDELSKWLKLIEAQTPVLTDVCSQQFQLGLSGWDAALLSNKQDASLVPDVLITMGMATISKPLKSLFRTHKPKRHLHISKSTEVGDPFQTQPEIVQFDEVNFLNEFKSPSKPSKLLKSKWEQFISGNPIETNGWSLNFQQEFQWVHTFMKQLNEHDVLHLGNSMAVRYGSWAGTCKAPIYSNRGISGIDGCLSTALGFAKSCPEKNVYLIIGDVSAIYDAHGLWTDIPPNIKVIILNNQGGKIFDWIKGPNEYPPLKKYIQTPQDKDFSMLAAFYGIPHVRFPISEVDASISTIIDSNNNGAFLIELCSN